MKLCSLKTVYIFSMNLLTSSINYDMSVPFPMPIESLRNPEYRDNILIRTDRMKETHSCVTGHLLVGLDAHFVQANT